MAATYINKEFYKTIAPADRHYMNVSADSVSVLMEKLKAANIPFSATLNGYKNTVTVRKPDRERAAAIMDEVTGTGRSSRKIIGNIEYKYISDKKYIYTDAQTAYQVADLLVKDNNRKFSGIVNGDRATITVSGDENAALVNRLIDYLKNEDIIEELKQAGFKRVGMSGGFVNIQSSITGETCGFANMSAVRELFHDETNEFFNPTQHRIEKMDENLDPYYIFEYSIRSGKEVGVVYSNSNFMVFDHVSDAVDFAKNNDITLTNDNEQIEKWRQEDSDRDTERRAKFYDMVSEKFPQENGSYPDDLLYDPDSRSYSWVFYNPDGSEGRGEFVEKTITEEDVYNAYLKRIAASDEASGRNAFVSHLYEICAENTIDKYSGYFEGYEKYYLEPKSSTVRLYGISEYNGNAENIDRFIAMTEGNNSLIDEEKSKENSVVPETDNTPAVSKTLQLKDKIVSEYRDFMTGIKNKSVDEMLSMSYEMKAKNEIYLHIIDDIIDLSDERIDALLTSTNLLDEIYEEWTSLTDINGLPDIDVAFEETADNIIESFNRVQLEKKKDIYLDFSDTEIVRYNGRTDNYTLYPIGENLDGIAVRADPEKFGYADAAAMLDDDSFHYEVYAVMNDDRTHAELHFHALDKSIDIPVKLNRSEEENLVDSINEHELTLLPAIERAKFYITEYMRNEFNDEPDFSNLSAVSVAYTTHEVTDREIQSYVDLVNFRFFITYNDETVDEIKYDSLEKMMLTLKSLEFDDLVAIDNGSLIDYYTKRFDDIGANDRYEINQENKTVYMSYYNPDSSAGGEIVHNTFGFDTLKAAFESDKPYDYISEHSKQTHTSIDDEGFLADAEKYLDTDNAIFGERDEGIRRLAKTVFPELNNTSIDEKSNNNYDPVKAEEIRKELKEKYGLDIDLGGLHDAVIMENTENEYLGGIDDNGHERKDNYTQNVIETEYRHRPDNTYSKHTDGEFPENLTELEVLSEIRDFVEEARTDANKSLAIIDNNGNKFYPMLKVPEEQLIDKVINAINDFSVDEYMQEADFSDKSNVEILITDVADNKLELKVNADLENFALKFFLDDKLLKQYDYDSLQDMYDSILEDISYERLMSEYGVIVMGISDDELISKYSAEVEVDKLPPVFVDDPRELAGDERKAYFDSVDSIRRVGKAIHDAVNDSYSGTNHYDLNKAFEAVLNDFAPEKVAFVLAKYIDNFSYDGRISRENIEWAQDILSGLPASAKNMRYLIGELEQLHATINDALVKVFRNEYFKVRSIMLQQKPDDGRLFITPDMAVSMWENGFVVYADGEKIPAYGEQVDRTEMFSDEKQFSADNTDVDQQIMIDRIAYKLDNICTVSEDYEGISNYAFEDDVHPFDWKTGLNVYQNIVQALLDHNTDFIEEYLYDADYSEDVQEALDELNKYKKSVASIERNAGKENVTEESQINFGLFGNGITAYDVSRTDPITNDYPIVAHISAEGVISWRDEPISDKDRQIIISEGAKQREKFMSEWNELSIEEQYFKMLERADLSVKIDIYKDDDLPMEKAVEKYMPYVIFKEGERPSVNASAAAKEVQSSESDIEKAIIENEPDTVEIPAEESKSDTINESSENIEVEGYSGTWYVIDSRTIGSKNMYLLESEIYGDEASGLIVDENRNVIADDVHSFDDYTSNFSEHEIALDLMNRSISFTLVDFDEIERYVFGGQLDDYDISNTYEYMDYTETSEFTDVNVHYEQYIFGNGDNEAITELTDYEAQYILAHWNDIRSEADLLSSDTYTEEIEREEDEIDEDTEREETEEKAADADEVSSGIYPEELPETRFTSVDADIRAQYDMLDYVPRPEYSPWGEIQSLYEINNGIFDVSTASHGGVMIRNDIADKVLSPEARAIGFTEDGYTCFEEDCDSTVAYRELMDKSLFRDINDFFKTMYGKSVNEKYPSFSNTLNKSVERFYPDYWKTRIEAISPGYSQVKRQALFSVSQNNEKRYFKTDKSIDGLLYDIEAGKSFAELSEMNSAGRISESEYAEIEQSAEFTYSVDVDLDFETAKIYSVNNGKGGIPEGDRNRSNISIENVELEINNDVKRGEEIPKMPDSPFGIKSDFTTLNVPTQAMLEHILRGGNDSQSIERIVNQFAKGKGTAENAEFLKREFV